MRTYRLAEGINADGLPFLFEGHAYLADGTPLTESDRYGRVVPARAELVTSKVTCSGGIARLVDRRSGIEALARALDAGDFVRAPLVLLHLQIDSSNAIAKFNPFHKPPGIGGGQFASGPEAGGSSVRGPGFQQVASRMNVDITSTYQEGIPGNGDVDIAHNLVRALLFKAMVLIDASGLRPGMPGYGQRLHDLLDIEIRAVQDPDLNVGQVYLLGARVPLGVRLPGSSAPDIVYGPVDHPLAVFELKTGRAADTTDAAVEAQKQRTLSNMPGNPAYDHFLVRGR